MARSASTPVRATAATTRAGAPRERLPRAPRAAAQVADVPQPVHERLPLGRDVREVAAADHVGGVAAGRATEAGVAAQRHEACARRSRLMRHSVALARSAAHRRARSCSSPRRVRRAGARRQRQSRDHHADPGGPAACLRRAPSGARFTAALLQAPLRVALGSARRPQDAQGEDEKEKPDGTYQQDRAHAGDLPSAARAAGPCPRPIYLRASGFSPTWRVCGRYRRCGNRKTT